MSINSVVKNVTTAGTAERISSTDLYVTSVTFRAKKGNTNDIYIGDMGVPVHGIVSLSTSGAAAMVPTITLYVG